MRLGISEVSIGIKRSCRHSLRTGHLIHWLLKLDYWVSSILNWIDQASVLAHTTKNSADDKKWLVFMISINYCILWFPFLFQFGYMHYWKWYIRNNPCFKGLANLPTQSFTKILDSFNMLYCTFSQLKTTIETVFLMMVLPLPLLVKIRKCTDIFQSFQV